MQLDGNLAYLLHLKKNWVYANEHNNMQQVQSLVPKSLIFANIIHPISGQVCESFQNKASVGTMLV